MGPEALTKGNLKSTEAETQQQPALPKDLLATERNCCSGRKKAESATGQIGCFDVTWGSSD